jgi:DNA-binding NarL/FixJ family response regulator
VVIGVVRVVVVDDEVLVCAHLRTILGSSPDRTCCARSGPVRAGFLVKSTPPEDLIGLVQVAAEGHTVLSPSAARRLIAASADGASASDRARKLTGLLTDRETEVLACLGEGLSNGQIAAQLYLSEATVKGYVSRMLDKLGCANRTQAGLIAHDAGLVRP